MLKIKNISFVKSYSDITAMPNDNLPEIAFIGRSNVGKSSLLNHLVGRKIAKISSTPGKTRLMNLFLVNKEMHFLDLPGYGYAKVSGRERKKWPVFIEKYLQEREQLNVICFLLDIRRTPNAQDLQMNNWFKSLQDIEVLYVLTKCDKVPVSKRYAAKKKIALELMVDINSFVLYSVTKNIGQVEFLKKLENVLEIKKKRQ